MSEEPLGLERVVTARTFALPAAELWDALMFYEEVPSRPPLVLRLLLPAPLGAKGRRSTVGDETRCLYRGGHLLKRVTRADEPSHYAFKVIEQTLLFGGIRLSGGSYTLRETADRATRVEVETRYHATRRPRSLWRRVEAAVCHRFHDYILASIETEATHPEDDSSGRAASAARRTR